MTTISAVIFDLDGCLVDSEPLSLDVLATEMRVIGMDASAESIRAKFLGVSMADICTYIAEQTRQPVPPGFVDRVETRLLETYRTHLRPIDGAYRLLDRLEAAGLPTAIATGGSLRRMHETLRLGGFGTRFVTTRFSAEQVVRGKPAPDLFLKAAQGLNISPEGCAVLEDSPHGIAGARAAGMRTVGFVGGSHLDAIRARHRAVLSQAGADVVIDTLDDAFEALTQRQG